MFRTLILSLSTLWLISACSTAAADPTATPFQTSTPLPTRAAPQLPSDFSGGEPQILSEAGQFDFIVTGESIMQLTRGMSIYSTVAGTSREPVRHQLFISATQSGASQQITIQFSPELAAGDYALHSPDTAIPGVATAEYARLASDGFDSQVLTFSEDVSGTLTITSVGETLSGSVVFSATASLVGTGGETITEQVTVEGTFSEIPFNPVTGDPFEVGVPLPTRNFTGTAEPLATAVEGD